MIVEALQLSSLDLRQEADRKRRQHYLFRDESGVLTCNKSPLNLTHTEPVLSVFDKTNRDDNTRSPDLIIKYVDNARRDPSCPKYRSIRLSNKVFDRITSSDQGIDFVRQCGFHVYVTDVDFIASIPLAANLELMLQEIKQLTSKI